MIVPHAPVGKGDVARHYDDLDRFYREIWGEHVHHGLFETGTEPPELAQKNLVVKVAEAAALRPGRSVVDVGCGYGATARILASDYGCEVTGYTLSRAQAEHARARTGRENPRILLGDFLENDLDSEAFDAAIAVESTEHFEDKPRLFAEMARVVKPGGRLVVAAWLSCDRPWRWERDLLLEPICREGRLPGLADVAEQKRMLWDAGCDLVSVEDLTPRVRKTWSICFARLCRALIERGDYRKALFDRRLEDRVFLKAMARIWIAESIRTMRYGLFVAKKRG